MTDKKFAFPYEDSIACVRFFRLIKTVRESSRMDRRAETDSGDGRRDQLGAGVRKADALYCSLSS